MSIINNQPNGFLIDMDTYIGQFANDMLQRFQIESSVLPCIYRGLSVSAGVGLNVEVTAGTARGQDIIFTESVPTATESLPTKVEITSTATVAVPAASTGWIVLNVNILPNGPTQPEDPTTGAYITEADDGAGSPTVTPVFVSSLSPSVGVSYPYTQIVLAAVTSDGAAITSISTDFASGERSFDWSLFLSTVSGRSSPIVKVWQNTSNAPVSTTDAITTTTPATQGAEVITLTIEPKFTTTKINIEAYIPIVKNSEPGYGVIGALYNMTDGTYITSTFVNPVNLSSGLGSVGGVLLLKAEINSFSGSKQFAVRIGTDTVGQGTVETTANLSVINTAIMKAEELFLS